MERLKNNSEIVQQLSDDLMSKEKPINIDIPTGAESSEKLFSKVDNVFNEIKVIKKFIKNKLVISSSEKLTGITDEALVYIAKEAITAADEDGVRTEDELIEIKEAVLPVVVQGAIEEAGIEQSTDDNPILELNKENTQPDLLNSIEMSHAEGLKLSNGENIASLAIRVIERNKEWGADLKKVSGPLGSNEGGWYEKPTGERFYVKFYENPNQGRSEFVANAVYKKLGIKAV